jgi:hypothetical protein
MAGEGAQALRVAARKTSPVERWHAPEPVLEEIGLGALADAGGT